MFETDKEGGFMAVDGQRGHAKSFQIEKRHVYRIIFSSN